MALMCGKNAIPRVGGRHQAGHYTATRGARLHGLYQLLKAHPSAIIPHLSELLL